MYRKTPADVRRERAFRTACWQVRDALAAITADDFETYAPQVIQAFTVKPPKGYTRGDLFWELDTRPGAFDTVGCPSWFSKLRTVRNTPDAGRRLFALFREA